MKERQGKVGVSERLFWIVRQDCLGRGRGRGRRERLVAGLLVRRLISSSAQTPWGKDRGHTLESDPAGPSPAPTFGCCLTLGKFHELCAVDSGGAGVRQHMSSVHSNSLELWARDPGPHSHSRRSEMIP